MMKDPVKYIKALLLQAHYTLAVNQPCSETCLFLNNTELHSQYFMLVMPTVQQHGIIGYLVTV